GEVRKSEGCVSYGVPISECKRHRCRRMEVLQPAVYLLCGVALERCRDPRSQPYEGRTVWKRHQLGCECPTDRRYQGEQDTGSGGSSTVEGREPCQPIRSCGLCDGGEGRPDHHRRVQLQAV